MIDGRLQRSAKESLHEHYTERWLRRIAAGADPVSIDQLLKLWLG